MYGKLGNKEPLENLKLAKIIRERHKFQDDKYLFLLKPTSFKGGA